MPLGVRFDDVTSCEVDVIVNSLGTKGCVYGRLCENIINTANDPVLKSFIDKQVNPVGTLLVTGAGNLKAKKIIHIVTPFKHQDDESNTLLKEAYSKCLNKAIELGYKSIALPFIGTGANGYSERDAYKSIMEVCSFVLEKEEELNKDIIDITVVGYLKKKNEIKERRIRQKIQLIKDEYRDRYGEYEEINFGLCLADSEPKNYSKEMYEFSLTMSEMNPSELLPIYQKLNKFKYSYDFVDCYLLHKNMSDKIFLHYGMDYKRKNQIKQIETLKKIDVYRLAFMCKMNKTETLQFMNCIGISFSPCSNLDRFYRDYINGKFSKKYVIEELYDLDVLAEKYKVKEVFSFN